MKTLRRNAGPFAERPYYELEDVEGICTDELQGVNLYPTNPERIRIDRFLEKRFGITPQFEDLPESVLGYTKFGPKGVEGIVVARSLGDDGSKTAERRINSTLAHEAGHALLHAHLFVFDAKPASLFGDTAQDRPQILCRDVAGVSRTKHTYAGQWWEFQANQTIGALLLPGRLLDQVLTPYLTTKGSLNVRTIDPSRRDEATAKVADIFEVNPIVVQIRLEQRYPQGSQLGL
jgi:hypothetical protein